MLLASNPPFRLYWLGQVVSQLGDRVHALALIWLVYSWTNSGLAVGAVMIAASLPGVLAGPFAGAMADRWDRRRLMIWSDAGRAVVVGCLAVAALTETLDLAGLIVATALLSVGAALFNPAALSLVPALVAPAELTRANAFVQLSATAGGVVGPLLGSGLIALIGVPLAFAANAVSFLVSGALIGAIRAPRQPSAGQTTLATEMREGLRLLRADPVMRRLLLPIVLCNFFFAALIVIIPVLAEAEFGRGAVGMGLMTSAYMAGMLLGAAIMAAVPPGMAPGTLVVACMTGMGTSMLVMGVFLSFPVAMAGLAAIGLALSLGNIVLIAVYQNRLAAADRGKVFGLLTALSLSQQPVAYGVTGALLELVPPALLLGVAGIGTMATGLSLLGSRQLAALQPPEVAAEGREDAVSESGR